jgi:E2 binding domain
MPSSRVRVSIPSVSFTHQLFVQHLAVTRHSKSQPARRHISTTTSCSLVQKAYIPTRSSMRSAMTVQCVAESPLRYLFRPAGQLSASLRCWSRSRTCRCSLVWYLCCSCIGCFCSQIKKPSLSTPTKHIYFQAPPQLEAATRPNLEKKVSELVPDGGDVTVTASTLPFNLSLRITYV